MMGSTAAAHSVPPTEGPVNYHWNWHIFLEPAPNGTGTYLDMLLSGLVLTIETAICAWITGADLRIGHRRAAHAALEASSWIGFVWVEFFRNMPLLVQLFLWFFVLPELLPQRLGAVAEANPQRAVLYGDDRDRAVHVGARRRTIARRDRIAAARTKFAATALGLTTVQTYRYVLLPMAFRIIMPPLTSEFLNTIKNTSVAITIGLIELTGEARSMQEFSFQVFEAFTAATVLYLLVNIVVVIAMRFLERSLAVPGYITGK